MTAGAEAPLVTVLMTTWNGARFVEQAIASVVAQTLHDWELLVVDDGSTDATPAILAAAAATDRRIVVHALERNVGMAASLNVGLSLARGRYIARLDQDDLARPGRLATQVAWLEAHPALAVCGSSAHCFGDLEYAWPVPPDPARLRCQTLFSSPFADPTAMSRAATLREHGLQYDPAYELAEDYDFWWRVARVAAIGAVPEVLTDIRIHGGQVSTRRRAAQQDAAARVHARALREVGIEATPAELRLHALLSEPGERDTAFVRDADRWLQRLGRANGDAGPFPAAPFDELLREYWLATCRASRGPAVVRCARYVRSPLRYRDARRLGAALRALAAA